jgi:serine phosphatase RsbU (regulator of sigma subunit)
VLRRNGSVERLSATATVLGIFDQWDCTIAEQQLDPGDALALYTDGITEARNSSDDEFGEQRLAAALQSHAALEPTDLLRAVVSDVRRHSPRDQQDDLTLIIARRR